MKHEKFHYGSIKEVQDTLQRLSVSLPLSDRFETLTRPLTIEGHTVPNRITIQPMEGCDGTETGCPDALTLRRYRRFAKSGAGLIWVEAVSVTEEGRANPRQLKIDEKNLDSFKRLVDEIRETSVRTNGYAPVLVMQATHSGRYAKPHGAPEPIIAYNNPIFEGDRPIDASRIATDSYLESLEETFARAALLAEKAGFDGVDIKCCHRYLLSELCSAYERPGKYGGSLENRTRLYRSAVKNAKQAVGGRTFITSRLNLYDGFPYPNGFGVAADGSTEPELTEAVWLVGQLHRKLGLQLLNFTIGNPYFNPHVNRPYDSGPYIPEEHPLEGLARMFGCISRVKSAYPDLAVISSGHSYLRQFAPYLAAGAVEQSVSSMAGFGREAFAYPDFVHDLFEKGAMDPNKCCITCGKCTELMRAGSVAGCVVRDAEVYAPLYLRDVKNHESGTV